MMIDFGVYAEGPTADLLLVCENCGWTYPYEAYKGLGGHSSLDGLVSMSRSHECEDSAE